MGVVALNRRVFAQLCMWAYVCLYIQNRYYRWGARSRFLFPSKLITWPFLHPGINANTEHPITLFSRCYSPQCTVDLRLDLFPIPSGRTLLSSSFLYGWPGGVRLVCLSVLQYCLACLKMGLVWVICSEKTKAVGQNINKSAFVSTFSKQLPQNNSVSLLQ